MALNAPKQITFWISVVLVVLAIIASFVAIPVLSANALWVAVLGFVVLAAGNVLSGL